MSLFFFFYLAKYLDTEIVGQQLRCCTQTSAVRSHVIEQPEWRWSVAPLLVSVLSLSVRRDCFPSLIRHTLLQKEEIKWTSSLVLYTDFCNDIVFGRIKKENHALVPALIKCACVG